MPLIERFSELPVARQALVRLAQDLNYGTIRNVPVRDGDPVLGPELIVVVDIKLGADDGWRPEIGLTDFNLPNELRALMRQLDSINNGEIEAIHVQAGLPRRLILRSRLGDGRQ
jgi:hypothetical protein